MKFLDTKYKKRGAAAAFLFHLVLLVLFLFFGLTQPVPLPEEESAIVSMDFGSTDAGMGDIESPAFSDNPTEVSETTANTEVTQAVETSAQEVATQVEESINTTTSTNQEQSSSTTDAQQEEKKVSDRLASMINAATNSNSGSSGGGQGNSNTAGNEGNPNGEDGKGVLGDGIGYSLAGRKIFKSPQKPTGFQEEGTVVVKIKVGRNGKIISTKIDYQQTTTANPALHALALKSAKTAEFYAKSDAKIEQWGTITFNFHLSGG